MIVTSEQKRSGMIGWAQKSWSADKLIKISQFCKSEFKIRKIMNSPEEEQVFTIRDSAGQNEYEILKYKNLIILGR